MLKLKLHRLVLVTVLVVAAGCENNEKVEEVGEALANTVLALSPAEYNNTVLDLLGLPEDVSAWLRSAAHCGPYQRLSGRAGGLFGTAGTQPPPWPWQFPPETGVDGFDGMIDGQEVSAYRTRRAAEGCRQPLAGFTLVSPEFFTCDAWAELASSEQAACAQASLIRFAQRAWRRPLRSAERSRLVSALEDAWRLGSAEEAVVLTVAGILQSPNFVFRVEVGAGDPDSTGHVTLTDWEIASRLSYLVWDSMPDAALFAAAAEGSLSSAEGIRDQTRRMLSDPRAERALVRFHEQWLDIDDVLSIAPAQRAYGPRYGLDVMPELDTTGDGEWPMVVGPIRHSMVAEFALFIRDVVLDGDARLSTLLTSNEGWVSGATEQIYGDAVVPRDGDSVAWSYDYIANSLPYSGTLSLRPVTWPADERAGLLTMPAVLAVGSYPCPSRTDLARRPPRRAPGLLRVWRATSGCGRCRASRHRERRGHQSVANRGRNEPGELRGLPRQHQSARIRIRALRRHGALSDTGWWSARGCQRRVYAGRG